MRDDTRQNGEQASSLLVDALRACSRGERQRAWEALLARPEDEVIAAFRCLWVGADIEERQRLLSALAIWASRAARVFLAEVMASRDPRLRRMAARAVGQHQVGAMESPLVPLLGDSDAEVRATAAWALGRVEARNAIPALIAATSDEKTEVVVAAAGALVAQEARVPAPTLERLIRRGHWKTAIYGLNLVRFADPGEVVTLRRAVEERLRHPDSRVRSAAREALAWMSFVEKQHA